MKAYVTIEIRDPKTGELIRRHRQPSRSYVQAWMHMCYAHYLGTNIQSKDIDGAAITTYPYSWNYVFDAGDGIDIQGIVVGTGLSEVAIDDYALESQIKHGSGPAQLDHGKQEFAPLLKEGDTLGFIATRAFINLSGAPITVNECGIYSRSRNSYVCIIRDRIMPQVVGYGLSLLVQYTQGISV